MVGTTLSHYRIVEELGRGGMGIVYKAEDEVLERTVAIKVLPPRLTPSKKEAARFRKEAKAAAALNHSNIATVHDLGQTEDGQTFIVMEFVSGETLSAQIKQGSLSTDESVRLAIEIGQGLSAAHSAGIVHRDVKPGNLMVNEQSGVKILDFGIAKVTDDSLSETARRYGTVRYMSPEQARCENVDKRTDIWSTGIVLYEMLTGIRPFEAEYDSAVMYSIINLDPVPPAEHKVDIPAELENIVLKCLAKEPRDRYESAQAFVDDLLRIQRGSKVFARSADRVRATRQRLIRRITKVAVPVLAALLLVLAIPSLRYKVFPWTVPEIRGIAVLPFVNIGEDPTTQSMVDGLVHVVTSKLMGLEQFHESLWVAASSEVIKRGVQTARMAGSELHVHMAVSGTVWRENDRIRLVLELIDARTEVSLTSEILNESLDDGSVMEESVVAHLANMLEIELLPDDQAKLLAGGTTVPGAYEFYVQGQGYLQRFEIPRNTDLAIELFERAIQRDSTFALARAGLGEAYWAKFILTQQVDWIDSAITESEAALALNEDLAPVHVTLGIIYNGKGDYSNAEESFERALEIDPSYGPGYIGLGASLNNQNKLVEAENAYLDAIRSKTDNWNYYNKLGIFYHGKGRRADAIEQFLRVTELAPDNAYGLNNLAVQYHLMGDTDQAESIYHRVTQVSGEAVLVKARAFYNLGGIVYLRRDFSGAVNMYTQSLALDSAYVESWGDLGNSYHWLEDSENARQAWNHAIRIAEKLIAVNPNSSAGLKILAETHAKLDNREESLSAIEQLLALQLVESATFRTVGKTYEILSDRKTALLYIGKALEAGHSVAAMESSIWLDDLRKDPEYEALLRQFEQ